MFTMVKAAELYPIREPQKESDDLQIPYQLVAGESVLFLGETRRGVISLSNYRLYVTTPQGHINLPLGLIEQVDAQDLFFLNIYCKDGRYYRINFGSATACEDWTKRVTDEISSPVKIEDIFAFAHYAWISETGLDESDLSENEITSAASCPSTAEMAATNGSSQVSWFRSELARLKFDLQGAWRVSLVNSDHKLCGTYPEELVLPACISDTVLEKVAQFRSSRRIPAVVWRNPMNGAVLARCSQPEVGWLGWRSAEDEELVRAIAYASTYDSGRQRTISESSVSEDSTGAGSNGEIPSLKDLSAEVAGLSEVKKVLIIDARSYAAAVGNRARGGGVECQEYYSNTEILFMNMPNIHSIRKSFNALRLLCHSTPEPTAWFQGLDSTKWLHHISGLLKAAVRCATALQVEGRPVIVHCSDGWDRTPQIVSLAELMLDPYYRTMDGFQVLVEKEWLDFGHKMSDRCGQGLGSQDQNERSPIFLQWLDCVHQLCLQFPVSFQFNLNFLYKIAQHTYSNIFGTFLANSLFERKQQKIRERTRSIWPFLRSNPAKFRNFLFVQKKEFLWPRCEVRDLLLWKEVYVGDISEGSNTPTAGSSDPLQCLPSLLLPEGSAGSVSTSSSQQHNDVGVGNGVAGSNGNGSLLNGNIHNNSFTASNSSNWQLAAGINGSAAGSSYSGTPAVASSTPDAAKFRGEGLPDLGLLYSFLDSDGLPTKYDKIQRRLVEIFSSHETQLYKLRRDIYLSRLGVNQGDIMPLDPGVEDQIESRSGVESATSEVSWEALDEGETMPTLWVPDHAASACMGCHTQFWFGLRKHHCRCCGRLFCSECSEQSVPIPSEQLYSPVRVCNSCYNQLTTSSCDHSTAAAVAHTTAVHAHYTTTVSHQLKITPATVDLTAQQLKVGVVLTDQVLPKEGTTAPKAAVSTGAAACAATAAYITGVNTQAVALSTERGAPILAAGIKGAPITAGATVSALTESVAATGGALTTRDEKLLTLQDLEHHLRPGDTNQQINKLEDQCQNYHEQLQDLQDQPGLLQDRDQVMSTSCKTIVAGDELGISGGAEINGSDVAPQGCARPTVNHEERRKSATTQ